MSGRESQPQQRTTDRQQLQEQDKVSRSCTALDLVAKHSPPLPAWPARPPKDRPASNKPDQLNVKWGWKDQHPQKSPASVRPPARRIATKTP